MKNILSLSRAAESQCPPGQKFGPGMRECYIIHYVISGKGYFAADGKRWTIGPGRAFIIYQGETMEYAADKDDPWRYTWIDFRGEIAEALLNTTGFSREKRVTPPLDNERILEIFHNFKNDFSSESGELQGIANLVELISEISSKFPSEKYTQETNSAERARHLMQRNYRNIECRVEEIAEMLGINRSQLYRTFIERYGITPKEYINTKRIDYAKKLLENGELSVSEVSYSSGFSDPLYFSGVFKRSLGMTPSEYKLRFKDTPRTVKSVEIEEPNE